MTVTPEMIQAVRREVGDIDPIFPILNDSDYEYFVTKNNESIRRSSLDAARAILLNLSINSSSRTVDVLSVNNSKRAESYRQALLMYLRNPDLNSIYSSLNIYGSGISNQDMLNNNNNTDNNYVKSYSIDSNNQSSNSDPWSISNVWIC